ncbi:MAG: ribonuclease HIII [Bacilli bacterium]
MNYVIIGNDHLINEIKNHYAHEIDQTSTIAHSQFVVKGHGFNIIIYNSKKIMFQGEKSFSQAVLWDQSLKDNKCSNMVYTKYNEHIGSDEVGTGDYFGPVVVVASYVNDEIINRIKHLKIVDSKQLNDDYIIKIAPDLIEIVPHFCYCLKNEQYNETIKNNNLNQIKARMHNYVILKLQSRFNHKVVSIIDQFCAPKKFYEYLDPQKSNAPNLVFETKAENKYLAVAIAAIIARYHFLSEMDNLSTITKVELLKGASNQVDLQGVLIVKEHGFEILNKIAKVHFKNTQKIKDLIKQ